MGDIDTFSSSSCQNLLRRGYTVYATSRSSTTVIGLDHPQAIILDLDVTNDSAVLEVVQKIIDDEGQIDLLINNAGVLAPGETLFIRIQSSALCLPDSH